MLEAAQKARQFVEGKTRTSLETDEQLQFALVRAIEIIGEAGSQVTQEFQSEHPQIPWRNVIGMRNRLIHGYFQVDLDLVWFTVEDSLPQLISLLSEILPPDVQDT